jgi:DNA-binding NarL/FixJ family response regulator
VVAASAVRRSGLETILKGGSDGVPLSVIGSLTRLDSLNLQLRQIEPDVVLVDLPHPDPQFLPAIRALPPHSAAIVALIDDPEARWSAAALRSGVQAILPRDSSPQEMEVAIRASHLGLVLLEPELAADLAGQVRNQTEEPVQTPLGELTAREIEVLRLLAEGAANKEIAQRLGISDHTVKFHISSILAKLGATSRTEAVTLGVRMGLIVL